MDWPDRRILHLFAIEIPIIQAPMAGATTPEMVIAVSEAGGLGSLPCAQYDLAQARAALEQVRAGTRRPYNFNVFCHRMPAVDATRSATWRRRLAPYYRELGLDPEMPAAGGGRTPFDAEFCALVEEFRPPVVSFHFGLPEPELFGRVKATGAKVLSSATTVHEARWLEQQGCDAVIAMGFEAGGHRGNFLADDPSDISQQVGTFALLPQVADAVNVPVIAAGGIGDARGIVAAFALGAAAVQLGTAYLLSPEANISGMHRVALLDAADDGTGITNVFTGRPARGFVTRLMREAGPIAKDAPAFPLVSGTLAPLRKEAEAQGRSDFTNLWAGQAARLARALPSAEITRRLAAEALAKLHTR